MTTKPMPPEYYAAAGWPLDKYPALNPGNFPDGPSFNVMRRTKEQKRAEAKDDENVSVFWKSCLARDGVEIDILFYEKRDKGNAIPSRPLLVAIHGGGTNSASWSYAGVLTIM